MALLMWCLRWVGGCVTGKRLCGGEVEGRGGGSLASRVSLLA